MACLTSLHPFWCRWMACCSPLSVYVSSAMYAHRRLVTRSALFGVRASHPHPAFVVCICHPPSFWVMLLLPAASSVGLAFSSAAMTALLFRPSSLMILLSYALSSPTLLLLSGVVCFAHLHLLGVSLGTSLTRFLLSTSLAMTACLQRSAYTLFARQECPRHRLCPFELLTLAKPVPASPHSTAPIAQCLLHHGTCQPSAPVLRSILFWMLQIFA